MKLNNKENDQDMGYMTDASQWDKSIGDGPIEDRQICDEKMQEIYYNGKKRSEQKESSARLNVGADRLDVGPTTSELNVWDGTLLKEVTRRSTMTKWVRRVVESIQSKGDTRTMEGLVNGVPTHLED